MLSTEDADEPAICGNGLPFEALTAGVATLTNPTC